MENSKLVKIIIFTPEEITPSNISNFETRKKKHNLAKLVGK